MEFLSRPDSFHQILVVIIESAKRCCEYSRRISLLREDLPGDRKLSGVKTFQRSTVMTCENQSFRAGRIIDRDGSGGWRWILLL
jgi:hypothetical protein